MKTYVTPHGQLYIELFESDLRPEAKRLENWMKLPLFRIPMDLNRLAHTIVFMGNGRQYTFKERFQLGNALYKSVLLDLSLVPPGRFQDFLMQHNNHENIRQDSDQG